MKNEEKIVVEQPQILYFLHEGKPVCHVWPQDGETHEHFGLMIADIISAVATHFGVERSDVMEWIQKEIDKPTNVMTKPN